MWQYEHTLEAEVTPAAVWRLYSDPSSWQTWDYGIESMELDDTFTAGGTGRLTPRGRDAIPFRLVEVDENVGFTDETEVEGLILRFIHRLEPVDDRRTPITHRVEITGPAADKVGPQIGPSITDGIPVTVATLVDLAAA